VTLSLPGGRSSFVVPARGHVVVPITVKVPANAYVGDHMAGVVAALAAKGQAGQGVSTPVDLEQRVGVRLSVRVAGVLKPELQIRDLTASYVGTLNPIAPGSAVVSYTVVNTGSVRLGGRQHVSVSGIVGPHAQADGIADLPLLLPGGSAHVTVTVPDVWPLVWERAEVSVDPLGVQGDANPVTTVTAVTSFWAIPWMLIAILITLGLLGYWWYRHRRATPPPTPGKREKEGADDEGDLVLAGAPAESSSEVES
jgi:hypothetical protein